MSEQQKNWIDSATYEQLLGKWRFAAVGDSMFQGETGDYYVKVMQSKRSEISSGDAVSISKRLGWA